MNQVSKLYDLLFAYERFFRSGPYPIHKKINHPTHGDIVDWVASFIEKSSSIHVNSLLDVGCGTGHSIERLKERFSNLSATGITISTSEYNQNCKLANNGTVYKRQSFDEPIGETYDFILAVESIKHSENLIKTLRNLSHALKPQGKLIIIDDWQVAEWSAKAKKQLKSAWSLYHIWTASELDEAIASSKLRLCAEEDFTGYVSTKPSVIVRALQFLHQLPICRVFYAGGLLEEAYGSGAFKYKVHVLELPN